jgi:hypothetical protein
MDRTSRAVAPRRPVATGGAGLHRQAGRRHRDRGQRRPAWGQPLRSRCGRRGVAGRRRRPPRSLRVAVAQPEGRSRGCDVAVVPGASGILFSGADGRGAADELLSELVQQVLRGPVQMFGVTVPGIAVGLAAVPPEPRADDAQAIDPEVGRTGSGIGHRGEHLSAAFLHAGSGCRQQARGQCRCRPGSRQACSGWARGLGFVEIALRVDTRRVVRLLPARPAGHPRVAFGAADDQQQCQVGAPSRDHRAPPVGPPLAA